jgi:hypothetical protein
LVFHAELRRDFAWRNLNLEFSGVLLGVLREDGRRGDLLCFPCAFGELHCNVNGVTCES